MNKAEAAKRRQSKPPQTETQAKNLEADFSDSTKWTWTYADIKNTDKRKSQTYKSQIEKKTQADKRWKRETRKTVTNKNQTQTRNKFIKKRVLYFRASA